MASDDIAEKKIEMMVYSNEHGIEWFNCKEVGLLMTQALKKDERKQFQLMNSPLGACPPFLIINANSIIRHQSSRCYRRKYSWGECDIENPDYTDFLLFYNLLIGYLYFPLKERTRVLYDFYVDSLHQRRKCLSQSARLKPQPTVQSTCYDFGLGMVMGVGILGAITLFAKKASLL